MNFLQVTANSERKRSLANFRSDGAISSFTVTACVVMPFSSIPSFILIVIFWYVKFLQSIGIFAKENIGLKTWQCHNFTVLGHAHQFQVILTVGKLTFYKAELMMYYWWNILSVIIFICQFHIVETDCTRYWQNLVKPLRFRKYCILWYAVWQENILKS